MLVKAKENYVTRLIMGLTKIQYICSFIQKGLQHLILPLSSRKDISNSVWAHVGYAVFY